MNSVPVIFFEGVASQFCYNETLLTARNLRGMPGRVISNAYANSYVHNMWLKNGRLVNEQNYNYGHQPVDIKTHSRKHLQYVAVTIRADVEEYGTDPEAMERVLSATKGKHVLLNFETPNISEEIAKCVESIRLVFDLKVEAKITSDVLKVMRSLVKKNTLNDITISESEKIEDETAQLLVDLLKQKQFHGMFLRGKCSAVLKTLIASWKENSEEMVGKRISCKEEFPELNLSSTEFPFEECTEEEELDARSAYYSPRYWPYITTKSVLRIQKRIIYCISLPSAEFKTKFMFD